MNPRKPCAGRSENRGLATGILILATALFASSCLAQQSTSFDDSQFVAEIPAVGTLALKLRKEYQGKRSATMLWLFDEISGTWKLQDGRILFYRQPTYGSEAEANPAFMISSLPDRRPLNQ